MALAQAGSFIGRTGVDVPKYIEFFDKTWSDLMEKQDQFPLQEYGERSMLTTWKMSYDQVLRQSENAAWLLRLWAFFYHDDLWYGLLAQSDRFFLALEVGEEFKLPTWLTKLAASELDFSSAMGLLKAYSLADSRGEGSYTMHSVLHQWSRSLSLAADSTSLIFTSVCVLANARLPKNDDKYWKLDRRLLQHVLHVSYELDSAQTLVQHGLPSGATHALGDLLRRQEKTNEAEQMYQRALAGYEKAYGSNHPLTFKTMNNLGMAYQGQGKLDEAEQMFEHILASNEKTLGPDHESTLNSINNLGALYAEQGKLDEAEKMLQRALAGVKRTRRPNHISMLRRVHNLGMIYARQGKLDEAVNMLQRALTGSEKAIGPDHASTVRTLKSLGNFYREQGRLEEAENLLLRALAGYEKLYGREASTGSLLHVVYNLGLLYHKQRRLEKAEQMFERGLVGEQQIYGRSHQRTIQSSEWLAFVRSGIGNFFHPYLLHSWVPS